MFAIFAYLVSYCVLAYTGRGSQPRVASESFRTKAACSRGSRCPDELGNIKDRENCWSFTYVLQLFSCSRFLAMAPDSRRRSSQATPAEISLVHNLKNCFVNLPSSLCSLLINVNTVRLQPHSLGIADICVARTKCYH